MNQRRDVLKLLSASSVGGLIPGAYALSDSIASQTDAGAPSVTVVAAYYGGWKNPLEPIVTWYGASVWGRDDVKKVFMRDYPERFPIYGTGDANTQETIDEDQQWVIDLHLAYARLAGISVFAVNWYQDQFFSYAADRMATSTVDLGVKFCIQWSNHFSQTSTTANKISFVLENVRKAALRMRNPRYWHRDGRPVFIMFSTFHLDNALRFAHGIANDKFPTAAQRAALTRDVRHVIGNVLSGDTTGGITPNGIVMSSTNPGPYLVLQTGDIGWFGIAGVDAITLYNTRTASYGGASRHAESFDELRKAARDAFSAGLALAQPRNKKYWPTAMAGWNKKPWGGTNPPQADNCLPPNAGAFEAHCAEMRSLAIAHSQSTDNTVFLYAFNELAEGGWVVPTNGIGYERLLALRTLAFDTGP